MATLVALKLARLLHTHTHTHTRARTHARTHALDSRSLICNVAGDVALLFWPYVDLLLVLCTVCGTQGSIEITCDINLHESPSWADVLWHRTDKLWFTDWLAETNVPKSAKALPDDLFARTTKTRYGCPSYDPTSMAHGCFFVGTKSLGNDSFHFRFIALLVRLGARAPHSPHLLQSLQCTSCCLLRERNDTRTHACKHARKHARTHASTHARPYEHVHTYVRKYVRRRTHTHTRTQTHTHTE